MKTIFERASAGRFEVHLVVEAKGSGSPGTQAKAGALAKSVQDAVEHLDAVQSTEGLDWADVEGEDDQIDVSFFVRITRGESIAASELQRQLEHLRSPKFNVVTASADEV